jgi:citrate lyase beta subunit
MRYFDHLSADQRELLFFREPEPYGPDSGPLLLATALGATLYSPADRPRLSQDVLGLTARGVTSMVLCLEDSIADGRLPDAERNLVHHLKVLAEVRSPLPQLFVRVRATAQIGALMGELGRAARILSGFVLPKFVESTGLGAIEAVVEASERIEQHLWVMPVLESGDIVGADTRPDALVGIRAVLRKYRPHVLAVRVGGTDLSSNFGIRRSRDLSIYDVLPVAAAIGDIVSVLGRTDGDGFIITGPVWEYFASGERLLKPQLRQSPFVAHREESLRARLIEASLDGLIREVLLDQANGLTGKTVIHPSHVAAVHALSTVSHEEYQDALSVLTTCEAGGGVSASTYRNKMNEGKPHHSWATRVLRRAKVFGVTRPEVCAVDVLAASVAS